MIRLAETPVENTFALDVQALARLRLDGKRDSKKAIATAAQEFESLFIQMMTKSMRDASFKSDLFSSQTQDFYKSIYDQQLSKMLSKKGLGLGQMMIDQLTKLEDVPANDLTESDKGIHSMEGHSKAMSNSLGSLLVSENGFERDNWPKKHKTTSELSHSSLLVNEFVENMKKHADKFTKITGLPVEYAIAHAAHESSWGQKMPRHIDGRSSFNLFGIKANKDWTGNVVESTTNEYIDGVIKNRVEKFKAYDSYAEAFRDYAYLLTDKPRYNRVLMSGTPWEFAKSLQLSGYATDPDYAKKLFQTIKNLSTS